MSQGEWASMKETHQFAVLAANSAYFDYDLSLARYNRASQIGRNYREYRITKVEYQFMPLVDTFTQSDFSSGTSQVPYLYAMIDKVGAFRDFNVAEDLEQAGCKPRRLDDKTLRVTYKPCALDYMYDKLNGTNNWARPITSPWLSCDKYNDTGPVTTYAPSSIDHMGLAWIVDAPPGVKYQVRVTAHFQFRKPALHDIVTDVDGTVVGATQAPSKVLESVPEAPLAT